jgi:hypothetical protein
VGTRLHQSRPPTRDRHQKSREQDPHSRRLTRRPG